MSLQITVMSLDFDSFSGPRTQTFSKNEVTFGRLPTNDVVLETPEVSQKHAKLRVKRDHSTGDMKIFVTDLGSTNGTLVENSPVIQKQDVEVASNVRIRIGNYLIKPSYLDDGLDEIKFEDHLQGRNGATNGHAEEVVAVFQPIEKIADDLSRFDFDSINEDNSDTVDGRTTRLFRIDDLEKYAIRPPSQPAAETAAEHSEIEVELPAIAIDKAAAAFVSQEQQQEAAIINAEPVEPVMNSAVELEYNPSPDFEAVITGTTDIADISDLNFDAIELHRLSGVILHRGQPLAGVSVVAEGLGQTSSGADGSFVFENIEDGTAYTLSLSKERFRFDTAQCRGVLSDSASISLNAVKLVTIQGRIVHKGQPLAGVVVDGGVLGTTVTSDDGVYRFEDIPENTEYTIRASKAGYRLR